MSDYGIDLSWIFFLVLIVLFYGEPDLHDAIMQALGSVAREK